MEEEPFPSITQQSQISSSQEEKLQNYLFAPELDAEDQASPWPVEVEPTGIVMVSLPDSCTDQFTLQEEESYDFHVPPGHPCSRSISSSDDQGLAIVAVDGHHVGFDVEMLAVDGGCSDTEKTVDLGDTEPILIKTGSIEIGATQVLDLEFEENCERSGAWLTENTVNVDKQTKETEAGCGIGNGDISAPNGGGHSAFKNSDKFKYVVSGGFDKKNDGLSVLQNCSNKRKNFSLDGFAIVSDDCNHQNHMAFIETAKKLGLTLPHPRWWPSEGVDDLDTDSGTLGFSEPKLMRDIAGGDGVIADECDRGISREEVYEPKFKKFWNSEGDTEPIVINTESIDTGTTQVLDLEFEENSEGLEASLTENTANVDKPMKETEVGYEVGTGDIAAQYVACGGFDKCGTKKRLEFSGYFEEQEKNDDGMSVPQVCFNKKKSFEELMLDVLEIFDDESEDTDVDFLETAKKRGLTFPWPRWWPPEGVADDIFHIKPKDLLCDLGIVAEVAVLF